MCNVSEGIKNKGIRIGIQQGVSDLADAVKCARKNGYNNKTQLIEAGYTDIVADAAISLL